MKDSFRDLEGVKPPTNGGRVKAMTLKQVESMFIPKATGRAFKVRAGQVLRVIQLEGPQVVDFNAWNADNPEEYFWAGRTRIIEAAHLTRGNRLWSVAPWMRVMCTIVEDTADPTPSPRGARFHDTFYPRCNRRYHQVFFEEQDRPNCHENLTKAVEPFGIGGVLVHDAFNLFMKTGIDGNDKLFAEMTDAKKGDYMDLRAEMDCIVALSACPGHTSPVLLPVGVEIYDQG
jgi:uncharacterized protein YcgI (DUF1989 family)